MLLFLWPSFLTKFSSFFLFDYISGSFSIVKRFCRIVWLILMERNGRKNQQECWKWNFSLHTEWIPFLYPMLYFIMLNCVLHALHPSVLMWVSCYLEVVMFIIFMWGSFCVSVTLLHSVILLHYTFVLLLSWDRVLLLICFVLIYRLLDGLQ